MYPDIQKWRGQGIEDKFNTQGHLKYLLLTATWGTKFKYHILVHVYAFSKNFSGSDMHMKPAFAVECFK